VPNDAAIERLMRQSRRDAMVMRELTLPTDAVVRFRSVLDAYEGLACVFAARRQRGSRPSGAFTLVTTPEQATELDAVVAELHTELGLDPAETRGEADVVHEG
jgi:hypothetical protein